MSFLPETCNAFRPCEVDPLVVERERRARVRIERARRRRIFRGRVARLAHWSLLVGAVLMTGVLSLLWTSSRLDPGTALTLAALAHLYLVAFIAVGYVRDYGRW